MLKDGLGTRVFIRLAILGLRAIAPLSITYCAARLLGPTPPRIPRAALTAIDVYAASEAIFFCFVYLPRKWWLNRPAPAILPDELNTRTKRRALFLRTWESTPLPEEYVSLWFKGVPIEKLGRENIKDWLSWRMFNKTFRSTEDEDELEEYLAHTEGVLKHSLPPGRTRFGSMVVTFERVRMMHRPLLWYLGIISLVDLQMAIYMRWYGYRFHGFSLVQQLLFTIPWRPLPMLINFKSPSKYLSYWHLKHASRDHIPVLFIHGIGVGLQFYLNFSKGLSQLNKEHGIGVISVEILPISSRITRPILQGDAMTEEIRRVLDHHNWDRCMVVSHSYGSVITTHMLRYQGTSSKIGSLLFVDPVAFSFHSPQVPWNFLRRTPRSASEMQLQYFASMDPDVAHTLTRKFVWPINSLWREDIEDRVSRLEDGSSSYKCTVAVSGRDIIVDTNTLGSYLTRDRSRDDEVKWYNQQNKFDDSWKDKTWTGDKALEVVYFPTRNHAEIFEDRDDQNLLLKVIANYSRNI